MSRAKSSSEATAALIEMEPELQRVRSVGLVLQALAETADAIEPLTLVVLAGSLIHSADQLEASWRSGLSRSETLGMTGLRP